MFNKLRLNMAVKNSFILGTALTAILLLILLANLFQLGYNVDLRLAEAAKMRGFRPAEGTFYRIADEEYSENAKYSLAIYLNYDGTYYVSNADFYDEDTLLAFVGQMPEFAASKEKSGRTVIHGNYMAYSVTHEKFAQSYNAFIYDYTREMKSLFEMALIILSVGVAGMVAIVIYCFRAAERSVLPIENVFNMQKELVGNASHELKTPLTIIGTNLCILKDNFEEIPIENRRWIEGIDTQVKRLNNLVLEMLELAKMDEMQSVPIINTQIPLSGIVQRVALEAEVLAYENDITFETNIEENVKMTGIEDNIEKLVYILIENAIKYTQTRGKVTVTVGYEKKHPVLKVRNTGQGISHADIDKLFDRFYRTNKAHNNFTENTNSFGLGLSIAKSIVDGHRGTINVESEVGRYTEFRVSFPTASVIKN